MQVKILTSSITEPVTVAQMRDYMGYPSHDQDELIGLLISSARKWLEDRTGLSFVSKSYKAYFEKEDAVDGWYRLPVAPVLSDPAIEVSVCGVSDTDFEQKGLDTVEIRPSTVLGSVSIGASVNVYYVEVTFQAGENNELANNCIKRIVSSLFNNREDGITDVSMAEMPFDTLQLISMLDNNTHI